MQIDNNDSGNNFGTNGAFMELWGYSGKDERRWRFTYLNNGYYKIESVISGKVLAVKAGSENVDGEALIQENYSGATRQQWNLEKLSTSYVLRARSSDSSRPPNDWCMCAGANVLGISAGLNVEQRRRSDDSDYKDEWVIECDQINIKSYFDKAFNLRYGSSVIYDLLSDIKDIYWKALSVKVNFFVPVSIVSTPDNCKIYNSGGVNSSTINNMCPANPSKSSPYCVYFNGNKANNDDCENCTSWKQIYRDFINVYPGSTKTVSILFTGNKLYDDNGRAYNRSFYWYNYGISIQEIYDSTADSYHKRMLSCIVHELAHFLGAPDHYHEMIEDSKGNTYCRGGDMCNECNGVNARPGWCLMDSCWRTDLLSCENDMIFCSDCLADIRKTIISRY